MKALVVGLLFLVCDPVLCSLNDPFTSFMEVSISPFAMNGNSDLNTMGMCPSNWDNLIEHLRTFISLLEPYGVKNTDPFSLFANEKKCVGVIRELLNKLRCIVHNSPTSENRRACEVTIERSIGNVKSTHTCLCPSWIEHPDDASLLVYSAKVVQNDEGGELFELRRPPVDPAKETMEEMEAEGKKAKLEKDVAVLELISSALKKPEDSPDGGIEGGLTSAELLDEVVLPKLPKSLFSSRLRRLLTLTFDRPLLIDYGVDVDEARNIIYEADSSGTGVLTIDDLNVWLDMQRKKKTVSVETFDRMSQLVYHAEKGLLREVCFKAIEIAKEEILKEPTAGPVDDDTVAAWLAFFADHETKSQLDIVLKSLKVINVNTNINGDPENADVVFPFIKAAVKTWEPRNKFFNEYQKYKFADHMRDVWRKKKLSPDERMLKQQHALYRAKLGKEKIPKSDAWLNPYFSSIQFSHEKFITYGEVARAAAPCRKKMQEQPCNTVVQLRFAANKIANSVATKLREDFSELATELAETSKKLQEEEETLQKLRRSAAEKTAETQTWHGRVKARVAQVTREQGKDDGHEETQTEEVVHGVTRTEEGTKENEKKKTEEGIFEKVFQRLAQGARQGIQAGAERVDEVVHNSDPKTGLGTIVAGSASAGSNTLVAFKLICQGFILAVFMVVFASSVGYQSSAEQLFPNGYQWLPNNTVLAQFHAFVQSEATTAAVAKVVAMVPDSIRDRYGVAFDGFSNIQIGSGQVGSGQVNVTADVVGGVANGLLGMLETLFWGTNGLTIYEKLLLWVAFLLSALILYLMAFYWKTKGTRPFDPETTHISLFLDVHFFHRIDFWGLLPIVGCFISICVRAVAYMENGGLNSQGVAKDGGKAKESLMVSLLELIAITHVVAGILQYSYSQGGEDKSSDVAKLMGEYQELHYKYDQDQTRWLTPQLLADIMNDFLKQYDDDAISVAKRKCEPQKDEQSSPGGPGLASEFDSFLRVRENRVASQHVVKLLTTLDLCKRFYGAARAEWLIDELTYVQTLFVQMTVALEAAPA